jgi:hypothetical protein
MLMRLSRTGGRHEGRVSLRTRVKPLQSPPPPTSIIASDALSLSLSLSVGGQDRKSAFGCMWCA